MRVIKGLLVLGLVVVLLAGAGVVVLRLGRGRASQPSEIKPNLVEVVNAGGIRLYAARVGAQAILFDTGLDPKGKPIDAALGALKAGRGDVSDVFLTHAHGDHIGGAAVVAKARIHLGAADVPIAEGRAAPDALMARIMGKMVPVPPLKVTDAMTGPATIDVGEGQVVKAFPVPGHTPGSYVFLYDGVLFVGDIMILKQGQLEPPSRLFDPHPEENKASIRSLKPLLGADAVDIVCTAHGGCTPKGLGRTLLEDLITRV